MGLDKEEKGSNPYKDEKKGGRRFGGKGKKDFLYFRLRRTERREDPDFS